MTLIAVLCVAMSIQTVAAEPDGNQASVYDYIKKASEDRQDELLYLLEEDISPPVMDSLRAALDSMQLAEETSQSDQEASLGYYMDALRLFRETWALYLEENREGASTSFSPEDDLPGDPGVPEDLDEKIKENQVKRLDNFNENLIKEYMKIVDKVNALTDFVSWNETDEISTAVNVAKQKFNELAKKIRRGEIEEVIDELDEEDIPFGDDFDKLLELEESISEKNLRKSTQEEEKVNSKETKIRDTTEEAPEEDEKPKSGDGNEKTQTEPNLANVQKPQDKEPDEEPEVEPEEEPEDEPIEEPEVEPQQEQEKEKKANSNLEPVTEEESEDKQAEKKEDKLQREVEKLEEKIDKLEEKLSKKKNNNK